MADEQNTGDAPVGGPVSPETTAPQAGVVAQYIKDLSFENPNAPASLQVMNAGKPAIDVNVNVGVRQMNDEVYEVELKISAKASTTPENGEAQTAFVVELAYGTLFGIRNVAADMMRPFLLVQAPNLMFPFARRIIADAARDGGFPPLMLEPINFEALYRAQLQQEAEQNGSDAAAAGGDAAADIPQPVNLN